MSSRFNLRKSPAVQAAPKQVVQRVSIPSYSVTVGPGNVAIQHSFAVPLFGLSRDAPVFTEAQCLTTDEASIAVCAMLEGGSDAHRVIVSFVPQRDIVPGEELVQNVVSNLKIDNTTTSQVSFNISIRTSAS